MDHLRGFKVVDEIVDVLQPPGAPVAVPVVHGDDGLGEQLLRHAPDLLGGQAGAGAGGDHQGVGAKEAADLPAVELGADVPHVGHLQAVGLQNVDEAGAPHDAADAVMPGLQGGDGEGAGALRLAGEGHALAVVVAVVLMTDEQLVRRHLQLGVAGGIVAVIGIDDHAIVNAE